MLKASGVSKSFRLASETIVAVDEVDIEVVAGEFVCVYGASGSGKSTLLSMLSAIDLPDAGEVFVDGTSTAGLSEDARADLRLTKVGVVFQDHNLIDEFTAAENVALPLMVRELDRDAVARDRPCPRRRPDHPARRRTDWISRLG